MTFREIDLAIRAYQERIAKLADIHGAMTEVIASLWAKRPPKLTRRGHQAESSEARNRTRQVTLQESSALLQEKGKVKRAKEHAEFEKTIEGTKTAELMQAYAAEE